MKFLTNLLVILPYSLRRKGEVLNRNSRCKSKVEDEKNVSFNTTQSRKTRFRRVPSSVLCPIRQVLALRLSDRRCGIVWRIQKNLEARRQLFYFLTLLQLQKSLTQRLSEMPSISCKNFHLNLSNLLKSHVVYLLPVHGKVLRTKSIII